jgi:uncharacterized protein YdaU (DUF1376 family)
MSKEKTRLPFYPMYAADFQASQSVELMSLAQRGLYITLLNRAWLGDGLPDDIGQIQRLAQATDVEFADAWPAVSQHFPVANDGRRRNPRQEAERHSAVEAHQKRVTAANTRWHADTRQKQSRYAMHMQSEAESHPEPDPQQIQIHNKSRFSDPEQESVPDSESNPEPRRTPKPRGKAKKKL